MILTVLSKILRGRTPALPVLLALAVVISLGVCLHLENPGAGAGESQGCEPELPLDLTWVAEDGDSDLPDAAITLVMTAKTNLPSVRLEILLPENVSLLSGPGDFQGKLGRGEEHRLGIRVSRTGAAKIQARVTAVTPSGLVFQKGAALDLASGNGASVRRNPGRVVCTPDGGRPVREFPARAEGEGRR